MDLLVQMKIVDMLLKLLRGDLRSLSAGSSYYPQKPLYTPKPVRAPLPRATPESQGIPSQALNLFLQELSAGQEINPHSVMVLRHGKVVLNASWAPYRSDYPHMMYSLSKSVTAVAVGLAIAEGDLSLQDRLVDIFPEKTNPLRVLWQKNLTVRHLLTMSSGINFNEAGSVLEKDWVRAFLDSDNAFEPGSSFFYNSLNTYMLSAAVVRRTGMGLVDYLTPRLFAPLGIEKVHWEKCPQGIEKGGWGLFLLPEDMAKLGQLFLQRGLWHTEKGDRQLIPEDWVDQMTTEQIRSDSECPDGYGYQVWLCPMEGAYQFNGVFGQNVFVLPRTQVVVIMTGGSRSLFPQGALTQLIRSYFDNPEICRSAPLLRDRGAERSLAETARGLHVERPAIPKERQTLFEALRTAGRREREIPPQETRLQGKTYVMESSNGGLLPLILQAVYSNYTDGLTSLRFALEDGALLLTVEEGKETNVLRVGFGGPEYSTLTFRQDSFLVGAEGEWAVDEDGLEVLKLSISFVETPDIRHIKLVFQGDDLLCKMDELPRVAEALQMVMNLMGGPAGGLEKQLMTSITQQHMKENIRRSVTPVILGRDSAAPPDDNPFRGL